MTSSVDLGWATVIVFAFSWFTVLKLLVSAFLKISLIVLMFWNIRHPLVYRFLESSLCDETGLAVAYGTDRSRMLE